MSELQETEKTDTEQSQQQVSLGEFLRASRERKGLSLQDVSGNLRYSVKQIDALEKNEFDALPDAMITRGFIRNYARLLEIDAEPLLASYRQSVSSDTDKVITVQSSIRPIQLTKETQPWLKYILASVLVLLLLLGWLFYMDYVPKQSSAPANKTSEAVEEAVPLSVEPLPEVALPAAQRQADGDAATANIVADTNSSAAPAGSDAKPAEGKTLPAPAKAEVKLPSQISTQPVSTPAVAPAKPTDKAVSMEFSGQAWVSITDKSGKVVFEKTAHSGDKETINAPLPLNVVIGNASATKLSLGGQDVDLAKNTKSNVARITLE